MLCSSAIFTASSALMLTVGGAVCAETIDATLAVTNMLRIVLRMMSTPEAIERREKDVVGVCGRRGNYGSACETIVVVQAFRPAVSRRPEGLHYMSGDFSHALKARARKAADLPEACRAANL